MPLDDEYEQKRFADDHVQHGAFSVETEEYFDQVLLAQGYKDADNPVAKPVPLIRKQNVSESVAEMLQKVNKAPFGMPKSSAHDLMGAKVIENGKTVGKITEVEGWDGDYTAKVEKIGPRPLPQKYTCTGCPALSHICAVDFAAPGHIVEAVRCMEAQRIIGINYRDDSEAPQWCPVTNKSPD